MMSAPAPVVLLIGATGAFGERLAEGLVRSGISVIGVARGKARLDEIALAWPPDQPGASDQNGPREAEAPPQKAEAPKEAGGTARAPRR